MACLADETSGGVTYLDDVECAFLARNINAQPNAPAIPRFLIVRVSESFDGESMVFWAIYVILSV